MLAFVVILIGMGLTIVFMPRGGEEDDDYGDYGSPDGAEPAWWPAFEEQFRAYARAVARDVPRRPPDGDSG
jgi:hypothetical protein